MRRTTWGAKAFIERSEVPHKAWAKRLGVHPISVAKLLAGQQSMQNGPAMHRLIELLDALDKGEWRWVRVGPRKRTDGWIWEGQANCEKPTKPTLKINVLEGRLSWGA